MFFLGRPPGFLPALRQVGEEHKSQYSERERDDAVDDEEPSPAGMAVDTTEIRIRSCLQETAKHVANRAGEPEDHGPLAYFLRSIP